MAQIKSDRTAVVSSRQIFPIELANKEITKFSPFKENKGKLSKNERIRDIIYESATDSTAHSIPHIFKRENIGLKVFWIICLLGATGVCAWMISTALIDYFMYETVTKSESILEIPTHFPAVSFCNMNPFVTNDSLQFVENILIQNGLYSPNGSNVGDL